MYVDMEASFRCQSHVGLADLFSYSCGDRARSVLLPRQPTQISVPRLNPRLRPPAREAGALKHCQPIGSDRVYTEYFYFTNLARWPRQASARESTASPAARIIHRRISYCSRGVRAHKQKLISRSCLQHWSVNLRTIIRNTSSHLNDFTRKRLNQVVST